MQRSTVRRAAETVTIFVATSVAALAIMLPISFASLAASLHVDLLVFNVPRAMTGAAFVAVITAAVTVAIGSERTARWTALLALSGIVVSHLAFIPDSTDGHLDSLSLPTLNFIDSLLAGVVIGALAVVVWNEPFLRTVYLFGALGGTILGDLTQSPTDPTSDGFSGALGSTLPLLFIAASALALTYFALTTATPPRTTIETAIPLAPVFAAVVTFTTTIITAFAVASHKSSVPYLVVASIVTIAAAVAAAMILPERDGVLILLMNSFAVAGSLVTTLPRSGWIDLATLAAIACGLLIGIRRPRPLVAATSVVVLACCVLATDFFAPPATLTAALGCLALGTVGGYCVGTAIPQSPTSGTVGLATLFVPSIGVALSDSGFGHLAYSSTWYRTTDLDRGVAPGAVAIAVALGCAVAVLALLRYRSAPPSTISS
ncbi:hypothetical protein [Nocardia alba]|uniref:MFS transporter n=1 Tax=Nocardia alba TaxID=225051 RepID=A0A4R1FZS5_9NOCA|nr:hypothetical protein [Nocardia alba]TCJ99279.1 hypothetical protein DFR71_0254 [Nocardia alba]